MSFSEFYQRVNLIYKCFGVAPWKFEENTAKYTPWFFAIGLLSSYWIFLGYHLIGKDVGTDQISSIVNYIQLFLNGLTFSVAIISTAANQKPFQRMLKYLDSIDEQLRSSGCPINYKNHSPVFYGGLLLFFIVLLLQGGIEVFVFVMHSPEVSVTYWIVHMVPFLVYGMCLQQSIFIIYCILLRCRKVHELLTRKNPSTKTSIVRSASDTPLKVHVTPSFRSCPDYGNTIKVIYKVTVGIDELCDRVNRYFGLTFLTSLLAIFAVTSIQGFHCFRISKDLDDIKNRNWWTFATAIFTVVVNTLLVAVLAFISDMVTSKAGSISNSVRKLQDEKTIQYSSWFHPVLINIKISAFGFFDINCLMLCAFISAWVTYLLILVQFNEISGSSQKPQLNFGVDH